MALLSRLVTRRSSIFGLSLVLLCVIVVQQLGTPAYGAELQSRQLLLSQNTPGSTATYQLSFVVQTAAQFGSVRVDFCSNDALIPDTCTPPAGFSLANAALSSQVGVTGFTISSLSTANELILSRTAQAITPGPVSFTLDNVQNPSVTGAYFARVQTYASSDASGSSSDYGGIAYNIMNSLSISAEVPPYLIFCTGTTMPQANCSQASGDYIDFGELSAQHSSQGSSQLLAATNAESGYTITMTGTTLQSGNDVIAPLVTNDVSRPGTAQFGINFRANTSPKIGSDPSGPGVGTPTANYDQPNFYRFDSGDIVASYAQPDNIREYTASYIVNVSQSQPAGIYVSTITYICLATF